VTGLEAWENGHCQARERGSQAWLGHEIDVDLVR